MLKFYSIFRRISSKMKTQQFQKSLDLRLPFSCFRNISPAVGDTKGTRNRGGTDSRAGLEGGEKKYENIEENLQFLNRPWFYRLLK